MAKPPKIEFSEKVINLQREYHTVNSKDSDDQLRRTASLIFDDIQFELREQTRGSVKYHMANWEYITAKSILIGNRKLSTKKEAVTAIVGFLLKPIRENLRKEVEKEAKKAAEKPKKKVVVKVKTKKTPETEDEEEEVDLPENLEVVAEVKVQIHERKLEYSEDDISILKAARNMETLAERREALSDVFELNQEQVLVYDKKRKKNIGFPRYAIDAVTQNLKEPLHQFKTEEDGNVFVFSDTDYQRLVRAVNKPFEKYKIERLVGIDVYTGQKTETILGSIQRNEKRKQELYTDTRLQTFIDIHPNATLKDLEEELTRIKNEEKKKMIEALKKEHDEVKKYALEFHAKIRRDAQRANRAPLRNITFNGNVKVGNIPNIEQLISKSIDKVKELNEKANVAVIGTNGTFYDAKHTFAPSERTWSDKYHKVTYDEANINNGNNRYGYSKDKVKTRWFRTVCTIPVDVKPDITDEHTYEIRAVLRPSIVKSKKAKTKINGETHEVDFGCLFAATYFYTLVSNTPIDEQYTKQGDYYNSGEKINYWARARIAVKRRKNHSSLDENKSIAEIEEELREKGTKITNTYYRTKTHKPDRESVRGDWVMTFRGVTFKAFNSQPNKKGKSVSPDVYFDEDDFRNPITEEAFSAFSKDYYTEGGKIRNSAFKPFIWSLAEKIAKVVPADENDNSPVVENVNPRWVMLEYGQYQSDKNGPWKGSGKYGLPHGVTSNGFSYQAPMGFKRVVDAQFNAIMAKSALYNKKKNGLNYGNASAYTRSNRNLSWNFDITKMTESQYKSLREVLQQEDSTLQIGNIHQMNSNIVWEMEEIK